MNRIQRLQIAVLGSAAMCLMLSATVNAGVILLPGRMDGDRFVASTAEPTPSYRIRYSTIVITIAGTSAETKIQETMTGPSESVNMVCLIPLPENVKPGSAEIGIGQPDDKIELLTEAEFLDAGRAQQMYETVAQGLDKVEILALTGKPALLVRTLELSQRIEIRVRFHQGVDDINGVHSLRCPSPTTRWADGPVARLSVTATIEGEQPLRAMFSPSHEATIQRDGLFRAVARVSADDWSGEDDFRLCWVADRNDLGLRALTYRDPQDNEGYFMLLGNPTGSADNEQVIAKDVIFVLDTSGSMRGEKIEQARAAIEYCLSQLNPDDRFNIVTFGTDVHSFRDQLVKRTAKEQAAAQDFVEAVIAQGRTNISGALDKALEGEAETGRPHITIFLTDGTPTAGELVPEKIVEAVTATGPCSTRIFIMGVGHDVNAHLLDRLAEATDGTSEYVTEDDEIDAKIASLYDRLSHPVLTDVLVDFGGLRTNSIYPRKLPALFKGSEFMLFGRYRDGGHHTFSVSGKLAGEPAKYTCSVNLPSESTGDATAFVAPLWAARKIGFLLQEIRLHGEDDELITEVVRLSKQFGIVTEYTEFLATSSGDVSTAVAIGEATRRLNVANAVQAGQWAFNQARNDLNLQQKMVASQDANFYLDRQGRRVATQRIQQFGDNVFYLRDGQWVDSQEAGERKLRKVKLFSDEYNELVRKDRRFAQSQRLGWAMSINVGEERIVVEKDGETQSEELLLLDQQQVPEQVQPGLNQFQQLRNGVQFNNIMPQNQLPLQQQEINQIPLNQLPKLPLNQVPNLDINQRRENDQNR